MMINLFNFSKYNQYYGITNLNKFNIMSKFLINQYVDITESNQLNVSLRYVLGYKVGSSFRVIQSFDKIDSAFDSKYDHEQMFPDRVYRVVRLSYSASYV